LNPPQRLTIASAWGDFSSAPFSEKAALIIFYLACVHTAFVQPTFEIVPGERAKLFTGLVCLAALISVLFIRNWRNHFRSTELIVCSLLPALIAASGVLSLTPVSSEFRGFVIASSSLGGFFCGRVLLSNEIRKGLLVWVCCALLVPIFIVSIAGHLHHANISLYFERDIHPLATRILLLFFAPVSLILTRRKPAATIGICLLVGAYLVFYASNLRSAMLIPFALAPLALLFGAVRLRVLVVLLIPLTVVLFFFFRSVPASKNAPENESSYYRAEMYPFSLHIALKHPWLGIGLRAPREAFLADYAVKYPYVTKEVFADSLSRTVTSENMYLNFLVDLGFPFTILYLAAIGYLLTRLVREIRFGPASQALPPIALMLSLCAALLHFTVLDGLLHPQVCWWFSLLLGLIPVLGQDRSRGQKIPA
jgi:hypothetical protein